MKKIFLQSTLFSLFLIMCSCNSDSNNSNPYINPNGSQVYQLRFTGMATAPGTKIEIHYLYDAPNESSFAEDVETITSNAINQEISGIHLVTSRILTGIYFKVLSGDGEFRDFDVHVTRLSDSQHLTVISGDESISTAGDFEDVLLVYNLIEGNGHYEYNPIDFD